MTKFLSQAGLSTLWSKMKSYINSRCPNVYIFATTSSMVSISASAPLPSRDEVNRGMALCFLATSTNPYALIPLSVSYGASNVTFTGFYCANGNTNSPLFIRFTSTSLTSSGTPTIVKNILSTTYSIGLGEFDEQFPIPVELVIPSDNTENTEA